VSRKKKKKKLGHGGRPSRTEFTQEIIHHGACWSAHTQQQWFYPPLSQLRASGKEKIKASAD